MPGGGSDEFGRRPPSYPHLTEEAGMPNVVVRY
jgi:hypothetical protein